MSAYVVTKDDKAKDSGEMKEVFEEESVGVNVEVKNFLDAVSNGSDTGHGNPRDALQDVAFIQAALTSQGAPVDLITLAQV